MTKVQIQKLREKVALSCRILGMRQGITIDKPAPLGINCRPIKGL